VLSGAFYLVGVAFFGDVHMSMGVCFSLVDTWHCPVFIWVSAVEMLMRVPCIHLRVLISPQPKLD
jgi:hypothetical protein